MRKSGGLGRRDLGGRIEVQAGVGASGQDGKTATAGFVSGMMKSIPPMSEMFDMAGMELPSYLGTRKEAEAPAAPAPAAEAPAPAPEA